MDPDDIIRRLDMHPHPEGGWYAETWRDPGADGVRGTGSAIYFLLKAGETSWWHRMDAPEIWHWYAGAPIELLTAPGTGDVAASRAVLGPDLAAGERPQILIPGGLWQTARSLGAFTLVGCSAAPAFEFTGWELAPRDWAPGTGRPTPEMPLA
jgi:predicted cupin superfamily sugar epimerase